MDIEQRNIDTGTHLAMQVAIRARREAKCVFQQALTSSSILQGGQDRHRPIPAPAEGTQEWDRCKTTQATYINRELELVKLAVRNLSASDTAALLIAAFETNPLPKKLCLPHAIASCCALRFGNIADCWCLDIRSTRTVSETEQRL